MEKIFFLKKVNGNISGKTKSSALLIFPTISAVLLALAFPPFNFWAAAYFFLIPVLYFIRHYNPSALAAFAVSFIAGLAGYGIILYWIFPTVVEYTGSVFQGAVSLFLLSGYVSLYYGIFGAIAAGCFKKEEESAAMFLPSVVFLPSVWVGLEYIRSFVFTGFPWAIIGYSQWNFRPALWVASYAGVFGVSFMVVMGNCIFLKGVKTTSSRIALFVFVLWLAAGVVKTSVGESGQNNNNFIGVTVIQPSVDQIKKWDERYFAQTKEKISALVLDGSVSSAKDAQDIFLWPETSLTEIVAPSGKNAGLPDWIKALVVQSGSHHIIGSLCQKNNKIYNSAILVSPDGNIIRIHNKTHLVPFGEFVPFRRLLEPFFGVFNEMGDIACGDAPTVMEMNGKKFSAIICSENLFGDITRRFVKNGAAALCVITNDAWYGKTPAAFQHFTFNVLRAVENSRWVVQSANTGISGVISDDGRVITATGLFETTHFYCRIPLLKENITFYTRSGDLFAIICLVISVGGCAGINIKRQRIANSE